MNDCITTTKQSTTKPCAYFLGYTVACCLLGVKPLPEPMMIYTNCTFRNKFRLNLDQNTSTFKKKMDFNVQFLVSL